jgi:hypothetical protein
MFRSSITCQLRLEALGDLPYAKLDMDVTHIRTQVVDRYVGEVEKLLRNKPAYPDVLTVWYML